MYDNFGKEYVKTRKENSPERAYNEYMELPAMIEAVGNIKGKKLLDIGCGAGIHIEKYLKKGTICEGIDISETMIELARKNVQQHYLKSDQLINFHMKIILSM